MRIEFNNYVFYLAGESRGTRYGFAHDAILTWYNAEDVNSYNMTRASCRYFNRTWENYRFQSVYLAALTQELNRITATVKRDFMANYGYKRMTAARREQFERYAAKNADIAALRRAMDIVRTCGGRDYTEQAETSAEHAAA